MYSSIPRTPPTTPTSPYPVSPLPRTPTSPYPFLPVPTTHVLARVSPPKRTRARDRRDVTTKNISYPTPQSRAPVAGPTPQTGYAPTIGTYKHQYVNEVFTDGSVRQPDGYGGVGIFYGDHDIRNEAIPISERSDINYLELEAILEALKNTPKENPLTIYTDSQTSIDLINTRKQMHERYRNIVRDIRNLKRNRIVNFVKVKSHTREPLDEGEHKTWHGNKQADKLATSASLIASI